MATPEAERLIVDVHLGEAGLPTSLAADVRTGLTANPKWLAPKYFYDDVGSLLFEQITELAEYYPARSERSILESAGPGLLEELRPVEILELGSGSSSKTRVLLRSTAAQRYLRRYLPFDVSERIVRESASALIDEFPYRSVHGVIGDFERDLLHVPEPQGSRLVLFLGGTIGNLHPPERTAFLSEVRTVMGAGGHALIGMDVVKDAAIMQRAYDDAAGVTAAFNRNVLHVINRELGADFVPEAFSHVALFNAGDSRIEMHLEARSEQRVRVAALDLDVTVASGERIWTEASYKFSRESAEADFAGAGLRLERWITSDDPGTRFALALVAAG